MRLWSHRHPSPSLRMRDRIPRGGAHRVAVREVRHHGGALLQGENVHACLPFSAARPMFEVDASRGETRRCPASRPGYQPGREAF